MAILVLRNVSKVFGRPDNGFDQFVAVHDVSLDMEAGEFIPSSTLRAAVNRRC